MASARAACNFESEVSGQTAVFVMQLSVRIPHEKVRPPGGALRCIDTHVYTIVFFGVALV